MSLQFPLKLLDHNQHLYGSRRENKKKSNKGNLVVIKYKKVKVKWLLWLRKKIKRRMNEIVRNSCWNNSEILVECC